MKNARMIAAAVLFALVFVGTGFAQGITVGFIATNFSNEATSRAANAFEKYAKAKGWTPIMLNSAGSVKTQGDQLQNLVQRKVKAIVLSHAHPLEIQDSLNEAFKAGIPVITIDSGYVDGVVADITADNFTIGAKMSTYFMDSLGGKGNIIVIKFQKHYGTRRRGKVFDEVLTEFSGVNVLGEYTITSPQTYMADTRNAMETFVTRFKDQINGVWCAFDTLAYVAGDVIQEHGLKNVIIVGADGNQETFKRIGEGKMTATIAQPFEDMAAKAVDLIDKIVVKKIPAATAAPQKIIYMDAPLIDKNNLP
ncbi:MAG TPA: sugar ABC transporter substrate-binding protein [Rectinemataceae bacterium]|nr:sugar ABC transporter substrate-binding protein [Rectinemataceae bacterium]